jgi:serine/threonine protein kinase
MGVIHCDLKPNNLLLVGTQQSGPKLGDCQKRTSACQDLPPSRLHGQQQHRRHHRVGCT